jgi:hypothetical protein
VDFSNGFFSTGSTLNSADIYGTPSVGGNVPDVLSVGGPNQGAVVGLQSGRMAGNAGAVAFSWVGLALLLVALRVVLELQNRT